MRVRVCRLPGQALGGTCAECLLGIGAHSLPLPLSVQVEAARSLNDINRKTAKEKANEVVSSLARLQERGSQLMHADQKIAQLQMDRARLEQEKAEMAAEVRSKASEARWLTFLCVRVKRMLPSVRYTLLGLAGSSFCSHTVSTPIRNLHRREK